jgi:hypothetical protein
MAKVARATIVLPVVYWPPAVLLDVLRPGLEAVACGVAQSKRQLKCAVRAREDLVLAPAHHRGVLLGICSGLLRSLGRSLLPGRAPLWHRGLERGLFPRLRQLAEQSLLLSCLLAEPDRSIAKASATVSQSISSHWAMANRFPARRTSEASPENPVLSHSHNPYSPLPLSNQDPVLCNDHHTAKLYACMQPASCC